jgi:hypothetical protein
MKFDANLSTDFNTSKINAGVCSFSIINCIETISKAGNEMLKVTMKITDSERNSVTINDYIVSSFVNKIKRFLDSVGLSSTFKNGEINADNLILLDGKCIIKYSEREEVKDEYGAIFLSYPKPIIKEYLAKNNNLEENLNAENNQQSTQFYESYDIQDEEIPF